MASNIAFAKMLAKHKNKVSNKQLKLQKKSKTCQNIKKPNIIQPLNTNINNYNTNNNNNNNDNMSKSKYRASTPNLLDVITNAIEYKKDPKKFVLLMSSILLLISLIIGTSYAALSYLSKTSYLNLLLIIL